MKVYALPVLLSIIFNIGAGGCSVTGDSGQKLFVLNDVTYQTWAVSADEHGTDILIYLERADPEIDFISVTFRGITVPVSKDIEGDKTVLKGRLILGASTLKDPEFEVTNNENSLKFIYQDREHIYPLNKIRRLPTKFFSK